MLRTEDMIFKRGEDSKLIAQEVELKLEGKPTIKVRPLTRGKLQEIYAISTSGSTEEKVKADSEVIKSGLVEPELTDEQLADLKPQYAGAISTAILSVSLGISQDEVTAQAEKVLSNQEAELKKN